MIQNEEYKRKLIELLKMDNELHEIVHAPPYPFINENPSQDDYKKMNEERDFLSGKIGCRIAKNKMILFDLLKEEFK